VEERFSQIVARADDEVVHELDPGPSGGLAESFYYAVVGLGHRHVLARFASDQAASRLPRVGPSAAHDGKQSSLGRDIAGDRLGVTAKISVRNREE
jgi:hypothetical protein